MSAVKEWSVAYSHRGTGSARERAMAIDGIYGVAAPIPGVTGDPHSTTLVASIKALAQEAVEEAGGESNEMARTRGRRRVFTSAFLCSLGSDFNGAIAFSAMNADSDDLDHRGSSGAVYVRSPWPGFDPTLAGAC